MVCRGGTIGMKSFLTLLKIETRLSFRSFDIWLFGIGMPIGILMLISTIGGNQMAAGTDYTYIQSAFASLITVGICATAFMGLPLTLADYRDKKVLKHFFVTPVSPWVLLITQVFVAMIVSITSAILVTIIAVFGFSYRMEGNILQFILSYILVMLSMYSMGMLIASVSRTIKVVNIVTSFVYFPMLFLSGATIPFEIFPKFIQSIANVLPLTHGIKLLKSVSLGITHDSILISIIILIAFIIVGTILSIILFRWE